MEIWDGYFKDGTLANQDLIRGEKIPKGLYHIVCDVLVRHIDGDYLLIQRDFRKPHFGGYFEATAGGSALKGEDIIACAKRELAEETGIASNSFELIGQCHSCNTIYYSYLCVTDWNKTSIILQEEETISYKWVSEKDFISFVNSHEMIDLQKERYKKFFRKMGYIT
ncbi:MAG: NUDIX hydrolase [Acutalibacteraceae bacterium]|nr:NUDIX hydrolase [Acutalibacteraceae bacterium]